MKGMYSATLFRLYPETVVGYSYEWSAELYVDQ